MSVYIVSYLIFIAVLLTHIIKPPLYCSQLVVSRGVATIDRFHCVIRPPLYCSQLVVSRGVAATLWSQATSLLQPAGLILSEATVVLSLRF